MLKYLCSDYNPTTRQSEDGVASLASGLQEHGLTKGEVLQLCNLAPTLPVELYCVSRNFGPSPFNFHPSIAVEGGPDEIR